MSDEIRSFSASASQATAVAAEPSFRDFLRDKAEQFGVVGQHQRRREWVDAIQRLLYEIKGWLRLSDPDGFLDVEQYTVLRTERGLGTYEAPALRIHLGTVEVDVVPVSREVPFIAIKGAAGSSSDFAGRIDIAATDGLRKYNILREAGAGEDKWQIRDERNQFTYLSRERFEMILRDLLS